jgi:hypothetical protein
MKKIWNFLKWHFINDFNPRYYATILIFLAICLTLNYAFDFEDDYLEVMTGYTKFFSYLAFYGIPYFFALITYVIFNNKKEVLWQSEFWIKSTFAITIMSLDSSMPYLDYLTDAFFHPDTRFWGYKVAINGTSFITVFIPILIFYYIYDRDKKHRYGLNTYTFDASPYFTMLLIMLPLVIIASFNDSFMRQYPMYKITSAHLHLVVPEWVTVAIYEVAYGLDFVTVEYLFRGFMVIGMMSLLGRGAVLTMVVIYCFLHFGKPAGEALSSIVGGYILGVIAYETKSVWGGIIVHMGIAWMMEAVAFIHKALL